VREGESHSFPTGFNIFSRDFCFADRPHSLDTLSRTFVTSICSAVFDAFLDSLPRDTPTTTAHDDTETMAKRLIPLLDRVLIEKIVAPTKSVGGILLPDSAVSKVGDTSSRETLPPVHAFQTVILPLYHAAVDTFAPRGAIGFDTRSFHTPWFCLASVFASLLQWPNDGWRKRDEGKNMFSPPARGRDDHRKASWWCRLAHALPLFRY
jgi:hypothetical protein